MYSKQECATKKRAINKRRALKPVSIVRVGQLSKKSDWLCCDKWEDDRYVDKAVYISDNSVHISVGEGSKYTIQKLR